MPDTPRPDDVERLAGWVDADSRETYLSLYADLTDPGHPGELARRRREIEVAVHDDAAVAVGFEASWEAAVKALEAVAGRPDTDGAAVFVSAVHDRAERFELAQPVPTQVVLDSSPYVRPLARFLDAYEDLAVVLIDGERVSIHLVEAARSRPVHRKAAGLAGRHSKGGWSQMRFQRNREMGLERFLDETIDHLERLVQEEDVERIMVAGSGTIKDRFVNRLPARLADRVSAVEAADADHDSEAGLIAGFIAQGRRQEADDSTAAVEELKAALKRGELAVVGPFPTVRAACDGRVELLLVETDREPGGSKCEEHETFFEPGERCSCGSDGTPVDLINEAVEYVALADGRTEFVDGDVPLLAAAGGMGALLRW